MCSTNKICNVASSKFFFVIAIVSVFVPSILAKEFVVGDKQGWKPNFSYQTWAEGKEFRDGDKLVFKYQPGEHNVLRVDGAGFQQCTAPAGIEALTTGNDVITLSSSGKRWYICDMASHCMSGNQKLTVTVVPQLGFPAASPAPSTTPKSAATGRAASTCWGWIVAVVGIVGMVMA